MANYIEYFARKEQHKSKYNTSDRVFGHWNKIPFVASVIREEAIGVLVQTDFPVKHNDIYQNILRVPVKDVKLLKEIE
jgi:hypothetical protein